MRGVNSDDDELMKTRGRVTEAANGGLGAMISEGTIAGQLVRGCRDWRSLRDKYVTSSSSSSEAKLSYTEKNKE